MKPRKIPASIVPVMVVLAFFFAWLVSTYFPIPSFDWKTEDIPVPANAKTVTLRVRGLKCRHSSQTMEPLLFFRQDDLKLEGYLRAVIYPEPGVGTMHLTYDPAKCDLRRVAKAVKLDSNGQESKFRVLLEVKVDRSSPTTLLHSLAESFEAQHEELFRACHKDGALGDVDFLRLVEVWGELFLEDLIPASEPDAQGRIKLLGLSVGDKIPMEDLVPELGMFVLEKTPAGWTIASAKWKNFVAEDF